MFDHDLSGLPDPETDRQFYDGVPFKRIIAWGIDVLIVSALVVTLVLSTFGIAAIFIFLLIFAVNFGYRWYCLNRYSATLGMQFVGIELRNHKGNKLSDHEALLHTALYIGMFFFGFILVLGSSIMMLINRRGQGLHDWMTGTTAINTPA